MNKFFKILVATIIPFFTYAQYGSTGLSNSMNMGMGNTHNAYSFGIYSLGVNPANTLNADDNSFEFNVIPLIGTRGGTNFISVNEFNYYFGGVDGEARKLTQDDKDNLINLFNNGGRVSADVNVQNLSFVYKVSDKIGAFGFAIDDAMGMNLQLPYSVPELLLSGNILNRNFLFNDAFIKTWWLRYYSLSYAREIENIGSKLFSKVTAGISLKLVNGFYYVGSERINTYLNTSNTEITGNADLLIRSAFSENIGMNYDFDSLSNKKSSMGVFPSPAGKGYGVDLGISTFLNDNIVFSIALTDLGSVNWTRNTAEYSSQGKILIDDITNEQQIDTLKNKITGEGKYINGFSTPLPTAFRFGAAIKFNSDDDFIPGQLVAAFDYNQGFNDMPGNSIKPRFSLGIDWKPVDWVPYIRTGVSIGGPDKFNWALGLGFNMNIAEINIATSDMQSLASLNDAHRVSFSFGTKFKF
ncbi:MAG TPA: DUF5723 family protein [Ignavibacteriaceae bacterium]|nr:DUF5723 family protein [Ignavibacteriaceae bacterium]